MSQVTFKKIKKHKVGSKKVKTRWMCIPCTIIVSNRDSHLSWHKRMEDEVKNASGFHRLIGSISKKEIKPDTGNKSESVSETEDVINN